MVNFFILKLKQKSIICIGRDTADSLLDAMMLSPGSPRTKTQTEDKIVVNKNDKVWFHNHIHALTSVYYLGGKCTEPL